MKQRSTVTGSELVMWMARRAIVPASLVLGACSADPVELGAGPLGVDRSALASYAAVWEGYVEAYQFDSGSDRVRLSLDSDGQGTLSFGIGEPLPQPSDPEAAFPFERFAEPGGLPYIDPLPIPIEAFDYRISGALVEGERLRASAPASQIFDAACAIQTPIPVTQTNVSLVTGSTGPAPEPGYDGPEYSCLPELGYSEGTPGTCYTGGSARLVSCTQASLCSNHCDCTVAACSARPATELRLDAALNDTGIRLEGTLLGVSDASRVTVRLTRLGAP